MLDLGTGESWRRLTQDPSVLRVQQDLPSYQAMPRYFIMPAIVLLSELTIVQIFQRTWHAYRLPARRS